MIPENNLPGGVTDMIQLLRTFVWDMRDKYIRFNYLNTYFLMHLPGGLGFEIRRRMIPRYFASCGERVDISEGVRFRGISRLSVGDNVRIGVDNFIQASGGVTLGNEVMLGPGVKIWSINHRYDDISKPIANQGYHHDPVVIGDGVWIGANVFILPGVNLPEGCVVSAGSVVHKKAYPPYSIIAGVPCRVIGNRLKGNGTPSKEEGNV